MKLTNSLTHSKENFTPAVGNTVTLYTCGPTVYDFAHIGNLRTFIFYDILRRALESQGYTVNHVMNITDVGHLTDDADAGEDKMEKGAAREGKSVWDIAKLYTDAFLADAQALNLLTPTTLPKATDHIQEQINLILRLEEKGLTYTTSDGVYFDTAQFPDYGKMARLDFEGMQEGARVEVSLEKRNPTDFALWKFSPTDSKRAMEWESPWGVGFPGWHVECSAMAMKYLGETMDIHAGGVDHLTVHHTNEIAQSEGATGKLFSRFWLHGEFLLMNGGKMSKSDGSFVTLADVVARGISPLAYRLFVLSAHYRSKLNFSWDALESAGTSFEKLVSLAASWDNAGAIGPAQEYVQRFMARVQDDLNMPQALAVVWELVHSDNPSSEKMAALLGMDHVLGLDIQHQVDTLKQKIASAGTDVQELMAKREKARAEKDFETADRLRDEIAAHGFVVEDTENGPVLKV